MQVAILTTFDIRGHVLTQNAFHGDMLCIVVLFCFELVAMC